MRPKQNPAVAGFTLNPLYPATEELWVLLSVSCPSSLSGFRQRTICSDHYQSSGISVLTDKRQEILWKMSQFSWKVHYRSLHKEYNINLNLIVKTSTNTCDCTHICISLWDSSPNPWVRKGKFLSLCQGKKKKTTKNTHINTTPATTEMNWRLSFSRNFTASCWLERAAGNPQKRLFTSLSLLEGSPGAPSQHYPNFPTLLPQTHSFFLYPLKSNIFLACLKTFATTPCVKKIKMPKIVGAQNEL